MEILINVQGTPNPNALKFIVNKDVVDTGKKVMFTEPKEARGITLAEKLMEIPNISQIYFFENVITVTQDGAGDWAVLTNQVQDIIQVCLPTHDPRSVFTDKGEQTKVTPENLNPDITKINEILDKTVRPYLQGDGGDLEVLEYNDHVVRVHYQGACGSCPSSTSGTLYAIQSILRAEFDPEIEVVI